LEGFRFKQFFVRHDRSAQKVGTDGVLLGAWADPGDARQVLDAGTGCGLIALMMAQRSAKEVQITGIDPDEGSILDARYNLEQSPWKAQLQFEQSSLEEHIGIYDHVISNPPFFLKSMEAPDPRRKSARHLSSIKEWMHHMERLSADDCCWSTILPYQDSERWLDAASDKGFSLSRKTVVYSKASKPPERLLMEWRRHFTESPKLDTLVLLEEADNRIRSKAYQELCADFYL
jgi:tRNA1Val (adenine37-N6)-methyltransferase